MPYHDWSDKDFDFDGLYNAGCYISKFVRRYSHTMLTWKEKYGTIRFEAIHSPNNVPSLNSGFIMRLLRKIFPCSYDKFWQKWTWFGWRVTVIAAKRAAKIWPHLRDEILEDLCADEELVGKKLHNEYWRTL
jgi:hypothetical protein